MITPASRHERKSGGHTKPGKIALTKESHVQQTVTEFLELDGWRAIRTDPVSRKEWGKGFGEIGMPDYLFVRYDNEYSYLSWVMWIEFKAPGRTPDAHQLAWHEAERARGGLVLVVDDIDGFIRWYGESGLKRR